MEAVPHRCGVNLNFSEKAAGGEPTPWLTSPSLRLWESPLGTRAGSELCWLSRSGNGGRSQLLTFPFPGEGPRWSERGGAEALSVMLVHVGPGWGGTKGDAKASDFLLARGLF